MNLTKVYTALEEGRRAKAAVDERLFPSEALFRAEIDARTAERLKAIPSHVKVSRDEIAAQERDALHTLWTREARQRVETAKALRDAARERLAEANQQARRRPRPTPALTDAQKANPLAPLLAETNQRLALAELRDAYASKPAKDWLRDLQHAERDGDALLEHFLDAGIDEAIGRAQVGTTSVQQLEHQRQLKAQLAEIREARVTPELRETLNGFAEQLATLDREVNGLSLTMLAAEQAEQVLPKVTPVPAEPQRPIAVMA